MVSFIQFPADYKGLHYAMGRSEKKKNALSFTKHFFCFDNKTSNGDVFNTYIFIRSTPF